MSIGEIILERMARNNDVGTKNEATRQQFVKAALLSVEKGARLLDAGAGEQQFKKYCDHLQYVSQDFAGYDGKGDGVGLQQGNWEYEKLSIVSDIVNIPEKDGSFDVILCTEVFEHLPEPVLAIKEFSRLLRKGGKLIITAPFCSLTHFSPYHYYTGFNRYFYEYHLKNSDFRLDECLANGSYFQFLAQELHRLDDISERYGCMKPSWYQKLAKQIILNWLNITSKKDTNSNELLNFGFHILATKI